MGRLNVIDKNGLSEKVIKLSALKSAREIVDVLKKEDNVTVTQPLISRYIKTVREERREATKAVIEETVRPGLTSDLAFFDEMLFAYRELFRSTVGLETDAEGNLRIKEGVKVDPDIMLQTGKEYRATVEAKLKVSGGTQDDDRKAYICIDIERV